MPYTQLAKIVIGDVTTETLDGSGNFDVLMRTMLLHIEKEYAKGRIKGTEYSTVYLGALNAVLEKAMAFTMEVDKSWLEAEILRLEAEKLEIEKQKVTAEITVLVAQECKLRAEFDVLEQQKLKTIEETGLLAQKRQTELAQTNGAAVTTDSVLGKQIALYGKQTDGFDRDAEQKAAKVMVDTWNVRRTTDEATPADALNGLQDSNVKAAVDALLAGIA